MELVAVVQMCKATNSPFQLAYTYIVGTLIFSRNDEDGRKTELSLQNNRLYDLKKKELHYFNSGNTLTLCMASSALVPVFKPISYKEMLLIDGGLFDNIPIKPLQNRGYDIYAIDLFAKSEEHKIKKLKTKYLALF